MTAEMMEAVPCAECHIVFGLQATTVAALRTSHDTFYCPSGHAQYFKAPTVEPGAAALKAAYRALRLCEDTRDAFRRSNVALRGTITRMRNQRKDT